MIVIDKQTVKLLVTKVHSVTHGSAGSTGHPSIQTTVTCVYHGQDDPYSVEIVFSYLSAARHLPGDIIILEGLLLPPVLVPG